MSDRETRHLPLPDSETELYWEAAREHRLVFRRCLSCDQAFLYPRARCRRCFSADVEWEEAEGTGTIYSYTIVRQNHARPFRDRVPYVVVLVDLDEGPRLMTTAETEDPSHVAIGQRVRVQFRDEADGVVLPVVTIED